MDNYDSIDSKKHNRCASTSMSNWRLQNPNLSAISIDISDDISKKIKLSSSSEDEQSLDISRTSSEESNNDIDYDNKMSFQQHLSLFEKSGLNKPLGKRTSPKSIQFIHTEDSFRDFQDTHTV